MSSFFAALVSMAQRVGFDMDSYVECGDGLNMYFSQLAWDSPKFLAIKADQLIAHKLMSKNLKLSSGNKKWNDNHVIACRRRLGFHLMRTAIKHPTRVLDVLSYLLRTDPGVLLALLNDLPHSFRLIFADASYKN